MKVQPAVKQETLHVALGALICAVAACLLYYVVSLIIPETIHFDLLKVILGLIAGSAVAVLNFFLMGLTVQKVTASPDEDEARKFMKLSYTRRLGLQLLWIIVAILVPVFDTVAGILPLLFPGISIKVMGIIKRA